MSAIKGSYYPPEIIDTDGNIENEGVYGKNTPFVSDDHMGIINLQGANIDYLKTAVDNLGSNTTNALNTVKTDLTNLINSNKSTQDAKNTAYDSHLSTLDSNTATNASNITALQTSDNDKFKTATVSNATITLTKGTGATTSLTVNNVANATNATNASYTTTQAVTDNSTKIASTAFVQTAVANLVNSAPKTLDTLNVIYPVGIIVEFFNSVDPNTVWKGTTWELMEAGRVLISAGQYSESNYSHTYSLGETGGEATHTLTINEVPAHQHNGEAQLSGEHQHSTGWGERDIGPYGNEDNNGSHEGSGSTDHDNNSYLTSADGAHTHSIVTNVVGGGGAHNIVQPYIAVNRWKRTA